MDSEDFDSLLLGLALVGFGAWLLFWRTSSNGNAATDNGATGTDMLTQLAQAIYDFEDPQRNAVATRNNNPGNLRPPGGSSSFWPGQTGVDDRQFAVFDSFASGWNALVGDLTYKATHHSNWSLQDLFDVWLGGAPGVSPPAAEGNAVNYATRVASQIGVSITTTLGSLLGV